MYQLIRIIQIWASPLAYGNWCVIPFIHGNLGPILWPDENQKLMRRRWRRRRNMTIYIRSPRGGLSPNWGWCLCWDGVCLGGGVKSRYISKGKEYWSKIGLILFHLVDSRYGLELMSIPLVLCVPLHLSLNMNTYCVLLCLDTIVNDILRCVWVTLACWVMSSGQTCLVRSSGTCWFGSSG